MKNYVVIGCFGGIGKAVVDEIDSKSSNNETVNIINIDMDDSGDGDLTNPAEIRKLVDQIPAHVDGLAYCAGVNRPSWIGTTNIKDVMDTFMVNVIAFYELINQIIMAGKTAPFPAVIIASDAARIPMRCSAAYCASKAAVIQLVKTMTRELAIKGWRFNCVSPTLVEDTDMTRGIWAWLKEGRGWDQAQCLKEAVSSIPAGRPVSAAEVARVVFSLFSPYAEMINGANIEITGGK